MWITKLIFNHANLLGLWATRKRSSDVFVSGLRVQLKAFVL